MMIGAGQVITAADGLCSGAFDSVWFDEPAIPSFDEVSIKYPQYSIW